MSILKRVLFTEKNREFQCTEGSGPANVKMSSFLLSRHIINNCVCWWRKTAQNAWKWSVFLREQPTSSSTENAMDSVWQTSLCFHSISSPRAPADPSGHIQGSSGKGALPWAPGLPARPPSTGASDADLQELSHCPSPSLGREVPFPEHAWTIAERLLQECAAPGAAPAWGDRAVSVPKGCLEMNCGDGDQSWESRWERALVWVHYGNVHFHGQFLLLLWLEPANTTQRFPPRFLVSLPPPHCTLHPSHPLWVQMYKESCCFSGSLLFSAV